eukprot:jgi/Mesvir1/3533/Mv12004-RA.1
MDKHDFNWLNTFPVQVDDTEMDVERPVPPPTSQRSGVDAVPLDEDEWATAKVRYNPSKYEPYLPDGKPWHTGSFKNAESSFLDYTPTGVYFRNQQHPGQILEGLQAGSGSAAPDAQPLLRGEGSVLKGGSSYSRSKTMLQRNVEKEIRDVMGLNRTASLLGLSRTGSLVRGPSHTVSIDPVDLPPQDKSYTAEGAAPEAPSSPKTMARTWRDIRSRVTQASGVVRRMDRADKRDSIPSRPLVSYRKSLQSVTESVGSPRYAGGDAQHFWSSLTSTPRRLTAGFESPLGPGTGNTPQGTRLGNGPSPSQGPGRRSTRPSADKQAHEGLDHLGLLSIASAGDKSGPGSDGSPAEGDREGEGRPRGSYDTLPAAVGPRKLSTEDDGLIFGYRLNGMGGGVATTLEEWEAMPGDVENPVWLHLDGNSSAAYTWLWLQSGLEKLVVEALFADDTRPRSSGFNKGTLFVLRAVNVNRGSHQEDMVSLRLFVMPELLVTVRRRPLLAEDDVRALLAHEKGPRTAAGIAVLFCERCSLHMVPLVDELEDNLDWIEHQWSTDEELDKRNGASVELSNLRRRVVQIRRFVHPQRAAILDLLSENSEGPQWHDFHRQKLREVAETTTRLLEDLNVVWERANVLLDDMRSAHAEAVSHRVYLLSVVTGIFLPLTFITGMLGINVGGLPMAHEDYGFSVIVVFCLICMVVELIAFRALGWLKFT